MIEMPLKFGVFIDPLFLPLTYASTKSQALEAEKLGYESLWISDHLMSGREGLLECFTTLSALAAITAKIRLGSLVACNSYRRPSIVAKIAATLDVISKGRLEFGIGAGWNEEEYRAYGFPFPRAYIRIRQLREGVEIIRRMWTEERATFQGKYFHIVDAWCDPKPIQRPHPPITIGGSGEQLILRVVAEYADRSNWAGSVPECERKLTVLQKHCTHVKRDYDTIEKSWFGRVMIAENATTLTTNLKQLFDSGILYFRRPPPSFNAWYTSVKERGLIGTPEECIDKIQAYADLGIRYLILNFLDTPRTDNMKLFLNEIAPCL